MTPKKQKAFIVVLKRRQNQESETVKIVASSMFVNNRGDLCFAHQMGTYPQCTAAFSVGSWVQVMQESE